MNKPLVVSRSRPSSSSRRVRARREAELLRQDAARAVDGAFVIRADRMREIADLLESLVRRESSTGHTRVTPVMPSPLNVHGGNRVEQDLVALLMRSVERGGDA